jgi:hypothetical protein
MDDAPRRRSFGQDNQVEVGQVRGSCDHFDVDDLAVGDREVAHHARSSALRLHEAHGPVDDGRPGASGPTDDNLTQEL